MSEYTDNRKNPNWRPYCLMCSTMGRMTRTDYGFRCDGEGDYFNRKGCGNKIGFDLMHYNEPQSESGDIS